MLLIILLIILIFGFFTLASTVWSLLILPDFLIRFCFWMLTHTAYRIRYPCGSPRNVQHAEPISAPCRGYPTRSEF